MKTLYIAITMIAIILGGCSHAVEDYPTAVMWNDTIYGSGDMMTKEEGGKQIGEISKHVSTFPNKEGESNQYLASTTIYEVKGRSKNKTIAIEENEQYRVFNKE
ncbi:hypothetical protein [Metabacillus malikii]|uniref:Lipoprotein n=1 Tax=Metabacillus malikii TaxID=1504265 RepID=A0ABT9ZK68_9BACI|nr:hypothetical protein [Metabacillus malikii]MDQ0232689.1 hypothetical protein [Metabacillus malikii]